MVLAMRGRFFEVAAEALGRVIMWRSGVSIRATRLALMTMAFVLLSGGVARVTLTPPPAHYHDLMN